MSTLREQFIERLLKEIFQRQGSGFVVKGGIALRAKYGEHRYTKDIDLDFTNPKRTADSLHNTIAKSIERASAALGIRDTKVSRPGKNEKSPRWKLNFSDSDGHRFHVEIEVSRDASRAIPGNIEVQAFVPQADRSIARFWVDIYDQAGLISSKVAALLGRGLPRDIYDLDTLIAGAELPGNDQIEWAVETSIPHDQDPHELLRDRLDAACWNRFESELRGSLLPDVASRIDEDEWIRIKRRVADGVAGMLTRLEDHGHA